MGGCGRSKPKIAKAVVWQEQAKNCNCTIINAENKYCKNNGVATVILVDCKRTIPYHAYGWQETGSNFHHGPHENGSPFVTVAPTKTDPHFHHGCRETETP